MVLARPRRQFLLKTYVINRLILLREKLEEKLCINKAPAKYLFHKTCEQNNFVNKLYTYYDHLSF